MRYQVHKLGGRKNVIIEELQDGEEAYVPEVGSTFLGFQEAVVPESAREKLRNDSLRILSRSLSENAAGGESTGLVVGQVQSGKTMSYEGIICLARDNSFPLVIVISGISTPLLDQGRGRLRLDLNAAARGAWHFLSNPSVDDGSSLRILESLQSEWQDPDVPGRQRRTAVISVLKHHGRLQKLSELLRSVGWSDRRVLIIDDEADQASLNTRPQRTRASATYQNLVDLRAALPAFHYLQYTATPQAPLLINIVDTLSPKFVYVLDAGEGYVGGETFFRGDADLVRPVPSLDIISAGAAPVDTPTSLTVAVRQFFLGLAYALTSSSFKDCRSMLIHPSQGTTLHETYVQWAEGLRRSWLEIIEKRDSSPEDFADLLDDFLETREDLARYETGFPPLQDLIPYLKIALNKTNVMEMNARERGSTPLVPWDDFDGFILVGGQAMDRGFTVRGLTVTYMPRGLGGGNADALQQRARFFGYKASYLSLCRVHLESDVLSAFGKYVEHEIDMRARLRAIQESGESLDNWRRAFVLDPTLRPTRQSVVRSGFVSDELSNEWFYDRRPPQNERIISKGRERISMLLTELNFLELPELADRSGAQRHKLARDVPLQHAIEILASVPSVDASMSMRAVGLMIQLEKALEDDHDEVCDIYWMRPDNPASRGLNADGVTIRELFQGRSAGYAGDRSFLNRERVTLQVSFLNLEQDQVVVAQLVPVVATWVPERLATGWYVQDTVV